MFENVNATVPLFVTVNCCDLAVPNGWFPKERLDAERVTVDVLPVKLSTGLGMALLRASLPVIVIDAFRIPLAVGLNVTVIEHWLPGSIAVMQVAAFETAKSPAWGPASVMLVIVTGASPFVIVKVCGTLVVPRLCAEKTKPEGLTAIPC